MNNLFQKRYSIKLIWLISFIFILVSLIVFFILYIIIEWNAKEAFDYTTKFVLATLAFLTLLYHLHNLENQIKTQQKSNQQNLAKYTYDVCADFRKPMMMDINENLRCLVSEQKYNLTERNIKKFVKFVDNPKNKKYRKSLIVTLNYFEGVSGMVLAGDLDNTVVKKAFGGLFGRYYDELKYYIDYRQKESPRSWINFEKLVKIWKEEIRS